MQPTTGEALFAAAQGSFQVGEGALEGHLDEEVGQDFQNLPFLEVGVVLQKK